jgi:hypothetical protein
MGLWIPQRCGLPDKDQCVNGTPAGIGDHQLILTPAALALWLALLVVIKWLLGAFT